MHKLFELEALAQRLTNIVEGRVTAPAIVDQFKTHNSWAQNLLTKESEENKRLGKIVKTGCTIFVGHKPLPKKELGKPATVRQRPGIIFEIRGLRSTLSISCEARGGGHFMPTGYTFVDKD